MPNLTAYARLSAKQGRLETRHLYEIEQALSEEGLKRSRNAAIVEWSKIDEMRSNKTTSAPSGKPIARPYAHPYFWAGFIYTGL